MEKHTTCVRCGDPLTRPRQMLYCSPECGDRARASKSEKRRGPRNDRAPRPPRKAACIACGADFDMDRRSVKTTCGDPLCAVFNRTGEWPSRLVKRDMRSPLRIAIESGDAESAISILKQSTVTDANGCWTWTGRLGRDGYSRPSVGGRVVSGHRLMATLVYGDLKGSAVVHHKCANRQCINPDHLQPVSHRENVAEMLQRNYYLSRIEELERALECVDPLNSALKPSAA